MEGVQRQAYGREVHLGLVVGWLWGVLSGGIPCSALARAVAAVVMPSSSGCFSRAWYAVNILEMDALTVSGSMEDGCRRECSVNMRFARCTMSKSSPSPAVVSRLRLDMFAMRVGIAAKYLQMMTCGEPKI